ncbi:CLD8 protein, partial [Serilophus lunatus]|nr:CLD8 protein [Serilophus lunatus]
MLGGALQVVGLLLGALGVLGTIAATAMPQWRVSAFIECNIIFEAIWEGLWVHCIRQVNIRMQCKAYDSVLALSSNLQAARGLMCVGLGLFLLALMVAVAGTGCTWCPRSPWQAMGCILPAAGLLLILSGLVELVPFCWVANSIISDFYNPLVNVARKRELGEALYLGWGASFCLVAAGVTFCCSSCCAEKPRSSRCSSLSQNSAHRQHLHSRTDSSY